MDIVPWETCFCGCNEFRIKKPGKWWKIVCSNCKCERSIHTPNIAVDEYTVSVPFAPKHTHPIDIVKDEDK